MKGFCVRGSWIPNRTATYWPPLLCPQQRLFSVLPGCSTGDQGASLSGCWFSLPHLISDSSDLQTATAQSGAWGPTLLGGGFLYNHLSPSDGISCALDYIIVPRPLSSCGRHKSHSFNPSTVKVIFWYTSTRCTCYLHRCISYFDSPVGSEVNIQHNH